VPARAISSRNNRPPWGLHIDRAESFCGSALFVCIKNQYSLWVFNDIKPGKFIKNTCIYFTAERQDDGFKCSLPEGACG